MEQETKNDKHCPLKNKLVDINVVEYNKAFIQQAITKPFDRRTRTGTGGRNA